LGTAPKQFDCIASKSQQTPFWPAQSESRGAQVCHTCPCRYTLRELGSAEPLVMENSPGSDARVFIPNAG